MTAQLVHPLDPTYDPGGFDYTVLPPMTQAFTGVGDGAATLRDLRTVIEHAITQHPRSLQKRIGPSELGTPCDHCLAAKLAGWEETPGGVPWLPTIGTAVHAWLEEAVTEHGDGPNPMHTTGRRFLLEQRVTVGTVGGQEISGSCDLFDVVNGVVVDWKIVGDSTLRTAKKAPSATYRTQVNLYGRGWVNAGHEVRHVAIAYLPRNAVSLDQAVWWTEPYDEQIALDAVARADRIAIGLAQITAALGVAGRDAYISGLPRAARCYSCPRYPDGAGMPAPGHRPAGSDLAGLIPPS